MIGAAIASPESPDLTTTKVVTCGARLHLFVVYRLSEQRRTLIAMTPSTTPPPAGRATVASAVGRITVTVLAVAFCVFSSMVVLVVEATPPDDPAAIEFHWRAVVGFFLAIAAAVGLVWRHRRPVLVCLLAYIPPLFFVTDSAAALIALSAVALSRRDRWLWISTAAVALSTTIAVWYDAQRIAEMAPMQWMFNGLTQTQVVVPFPAVIIVGLVLTGIPLGIGLLRKSRRDLRRAQSVGVVLQDQVARRDERTRIARDMHDVLGHRLSLLSLQAGALEVSTDSGQSSEAARMVRDTAAQAIDDLRHVVGVLRDETGMAHAYGARDDAGAHLDALPKLITDARMSGLSVNVTVMINQAAQAPGELGLAAYRIVQESLTNALRHAPDGPVELAVHGGPGTGLSINISNSLGESKAPLDAASGNGLRGIKERVDAIGGTVSIGPTDSGRFEVAAWLPWPNGGSPAA